MNVTFKESWKRAETRVFAECLARLQHKENMQAFRGYLPVDRPGVWALFTGGGTDNLESIQTVGAANPPCFALLWQNGHFMCAYASRDEAMDWASAIMGVFRDTKNFNQLDNVKSCCISAMPGEPVPVPIGDQNNPLIVWVVEVQFRLIYATETVYS